MTQNESALSRLVWFFAKNAFIILAILLVLALAFMTALTSANVYIVVEEGMSERADTVLKSYDDADLDRYFTKEFLDADKLLSSKRYQNYTITSFTYVGEPTGYICWPWQNSTIVRVTDVVSNIDGELSADKLADESNQTRVPPAWDNGVYNVRLKRVSGKWKIDSMQLVNDVKIEPTPVRSEKPLPTPSVSLGLSPGLSPSPTATKR